MLNDMVTQAELEKRIEIITLVLMAYMRNNNVEEIEIEEPKNYPDFLTFRLDFFPIEKNSNGKEVIKVKIVKDDSLAH